MKRLRHAIIRALVGAGIGFLLVMNYARWLITSVSVLLGVGVICGAMVLGAGMGIWSSPADARKPPTEADSSARENPPGRRAARRRDRAVMWMFLTVVVLAVSAGAVFLIVDVLAHARGER